MLCCNLIQLCGYIYKITIQIHRFDTFIFALSSLLFHLCSFIFALSSLLCSLKFFPAIPFVWWRGKAFSDILKTRRKKKKSEFLWSFLIKLLYLQSKRWLIGHHLHRIYWNHEVLDFRKSLGGMAAIATAHWRRPQPTEPTIYRRFQLQQQPYRGQYADLRTDRDITALW